MVFKLTVSSERRLGGGHGGPGGGGDQVVEGVVGDVPGDAPALVADPDGHVVLALGEEHLDFGQLGRLAVRLHRGTHRVLEELEQDVVEVGRGVD